MPRTLELLWADESGKPGETPHFNLFLQGFEVGKTVTLELWEVSRHLQDAGQAERKLGTITGTVAQAGGSVRQTLKSTSADPSAAAGKDPVVTIVVEQPGAGKAYAFPLAPTGGPPAPDVWAVRARLKDEPAIRSGIVHISFEDWRAPETQATYRWHAGHAVEFYNDGSTDAAGSAGYFHDLLEALTEARHFIFMADWSFHPYLRVIPGDSQTLGLRLANFCTSGADRIVAIHTWDHTAPLGLGPAYDPQNDDGERLLKQINKPDNLLWRASSRTGEEGDAGFGWSHHQKFVVLDAPCPWDPQRRMLRVFIGGLDLTKGRFDWPEHPILPADDPGCAALLQVTDALKLTFKQRAGLSPEEGVHNWYTGEFGDKTPVARDSRKRPVAVDATAKDFHPREPWHDIHARVTGPAAWDIVREFIGRWNLDPAGPVFRAEGDRNDSCRKRLVDFLTGTLFDKTRFVQQWEAHPGPWCAQILRSITRDHWGADKPVITPAAHKKGRTEFVWTIDRPKFERSIQDAYLRAIAAAERFLYIETQFFIGVPEAANTIADALAARIEQRQGGNFHVYMVIPMFPEGDPGSGSDQCQRHYQWSSLNRLVRKVQGATGDWRRFLTIGYLANWATPDTGSPVTDGDRHIRTRINHRYMIYVHSKMMIADDRFMIVGSANLNERSLHGGRDSEICTGLWPGPGRLAECEASLREFRKRLWAEHFGSAAPDPDHPENPANAAALQAQGAINALLLHAKPAGGSRVGHFCTWFLDGTRDGLGLKGNKHAPSPPAPAGKNELGLITDPDTGLTVGDDWNVWPTPPFATLPKLAE